jgi:DNA-binding transcriptional MerR regulator
MQLINKKLTKLYYSIGEVADMFNVNASLIRFWEKEFSVLKPKKNKKGNRLFTVKDIKNLEKIYDLVKIKGFTLDGAKKELKQKNRENHIEGNDISDVNLQVMEKLEKIKLKLLKINSEI